MANVHGADDFPSATKCVLERFHIDKFRETQQDAILNLLRGKGVLVSQPTTSGKFGNLSVLRYHQLRGSDSLRLVVLRLPRWPILLRSKDRTMLLTSIGVRTAFVRKEQNDEERAVYLMSCLWISLFTTATYSKSLRLSPINEGHCIRHWKELE